LKHLLCLFDPVNLYTQVEQFEYSFWNFNIFGKHTLAINTADKHILEALENTLSGGPSTCRPTGQFHRFICIHQRKSCTPLN